MTLYSEAEYQLIHQDGKCMICEGSFLAPRIHRDSHGQICGLLCKRCSDAIRLLYHDCNLTERMTAFLRRNAITPDPR